MLSLRNTALSLVFTAAACYAAGPNLVTNGGFETGNFSGWTLNDPYHSSCVFVGMADDTRCDPATLYGGHSGNYAAELGNGGYNATLSQTLTTGPGGTYDVSFWLASQTYNEPGADFSVNWGNTTLLNLVNAPNSGYTFYNFSGLNAAGPTTTLTFTFRNDPAFFALDDVSVVDPPNNLPEPGPLATLSLVLTLPLLYALRRRSPQSGRVRP